MRQLTTQFFVGVAILGTTVLSGCAVSVAPDTDELSLEELQDLEDTVRAAMVDCLTAKGWDVESDDQGFGVSGIPVEQVEVYEADTATCRTETGADAIKPPALTDERLREFYRHESSTGECLRREGYAIPAMPSEQAFMDGYRTGEPWSAYAFIPENIQQSKWEALLASCPQL